MGDDLLDMRSAAAYVRRTPETVRRWVWSGRLPADRRDNRLFVSRSALDRIVAASGSSPSSLASWARALPSGHSGSAADLVLADRDARTGR